MLDDILEAMLNSIPDSYDKREGSFIYDAIYPMAEKILELNQALELTNEEMETAALSGDPLALRVYDRTGIARKAASFASGEITLIGSGTVSKGAIVETTGGIQFSVDENIEVDGSAIGSVTALVAGPSGNVPSGSITLFPVTLPGITAVTNASNTSGGFNEETDEDLLTRYYEKLQTPATSGNKYHYIQWAKEITGVGMAKVFPLWNGDNTVKVVIIDSNRHAASQELVDEVQAYIDPESSGKGEGAAPVGAYCTIATAAEIEINVTVTIVLTNGFAMETVQSNVEEGIKNYLKDVAFVKSIVSYAQIGSNILATEGVEDYMNLLVNGSTDSITLGDEELAVIGEVVLSE